MIVLNFHHSRKRMFITDKINCLNNRNCINNNDMYISNKYYFYSRYTFYIVYKVTSVPQSLF